MLALALAVLTACTGSPPGGPPDGPDPAPSRASALVATAGECSDTGSCVFGAFLGEDFYAGYACTPVEEGLLGEVIAVGEPGLAWDEFRTIAGAQTRILIAARAVEDFECGRTGWVLLKRVGREHSREEAFALHQDYCLVGDEDLCVDRVLEWDINSAKEHTGFAYLPERIDGVNAAVAAGDPEHTWRNDPFEVLRRELYWQRCGKHAPPQRRCRAGAWETERSATRIAITVLQQGASKAQYSSWETHFWLERLDGGTGWWLVERKKGKSTLHPGRGEPSRAASDARWADCCDVVLFDGGTE